MPKPPIPWPPPRAIRGVPEATQIKRVDTAAVLNDAFIAPPKFLWSLFAAMAFIFAGAVFPKKISRS
jgi:hypothetical protein